LLALLDWLFIGLLEFSLLKKLALMIKPFDFYFDFVSPYSFLAHKELRKIENKVGVKIRYKPILLGGLHNLHGIKAPAFIPAKAKFMVRDCKLIAERNNIKFKFNSYFPIKSLNLMRGVLIAEEDNIKNYYIDNIFNTIWQDGLNMNDDVIFQKVLKNLNINPKSFSLRSTSSSIKDSLRKKTNEAYEKGIFGAPTFVSNNKIFWGQDRVEFALKEANK
jgi:2-hydroxychromene-2-carboxylate isomerase